MYTGGPRKGFRQGKKLTKKQIEKRKHSIINRLKLQPHEKVFIETHPNTPEVSYFLHLYYMQADGRTPPGMERINEALKKVREAMPVKD